MYKQVVRKEADAHPIEIDPAVRLYYVEVEEPRLESPSSDARRLREALAREWQLEGLELDRTVLDDLQSTLRAGDWRVTAAVHDGNDDHRGLAGPARPRLRHRLRRRLDDSRRAPVRPHDRRGARLRRRDEPADPLR